MSITHLNFFIFLIASICMYYIIPKKHRWMVLLIASIVFFLMSSFRVIGYFAYGVLVSYVGARLMTEKCVKEVSKKKVVVITVVLQILGLFILKYFNIIPYTVNFFGKLFSIHWLNMKLIDLIAPIGISYYTLTSIAYVIDVFRGAFPAEKNIFKYILFVCYYPCIISGPIMRYQEMKEQFFSEHEMNWDDIFMGFHRILYGLLKKMVVADNLAILVQMIFSNPSKYSSFYLIVATFLYAIQIYCDFSGCMDMMLGASKCYGITLPENFMSPFFSKSLLEFWRRWHITLGAWGKDYIMYPLLTTNTFQKIGQKARSKWGKKTGKKIPVILSIFVLWLMIGIWHGASYKYIFVAGIMPWLYFTVGELYGDTHKKLVQKLKIRTESKIVRLLQSVRTVCFMCVIWFFALCPSLSVIPTYLRNIFVRSEVGIKEFIQTLALDIDGTAMIKGLIVLFMLIMGIIVALIGIFIVDFLKYREIEVGKKFNQKSMPFRYLMIFGMITIIILCGAYGPEYNPVDFIYGGF